MSDNQISVSTPQVLWHGGGNENGKPDPVYSVDFHPQEPIMCTSGIDANVPPKGSVRVSWNLDPPKVAIHSTNIVFCALYSCGELNLTRKGRSFCLICAIISRL